MTDGAKHEPNQGARGRAPGNGWLRRLRRGRQVVRARPLEGETRAAPGEPAARAHREEEPVRLDPRAPIRAGLPGGAAVVGSLGSGVRTVLEAVAGGLRAGELGVVLAGAGEGERWRDAVPFEVDVVRIGPGSRPRLIPEGGLTPGGAGKEQARAVVDLVAAVLGAEDDRERHALLLAVREQLDPSDLPFDGLGDVAFSYRLVAGLDALRRRSERGSELRRAATRVARSVCRKAHDPLASVVLGTPSQTDEIADALEDRGGGPRLVVVEVCLAPPLQGNPNYLADLSEGRRVVAALWPLLFLRVLEGVSFGAREDPSGAETPPPFSLLILPEAPGLVGAPSGRLALEWALRRSVCDNVAVWLGADKASQFEALTPLLTTRFFGRGSGERGVGARTAHPLREAGFCVPRTQDHRLSDLRPGEFIRVDPVEETGIVRVARPAEVVGVAVSAATDDALLTAPER